MTMKYVHIIKDTYECFFLCGDTSTSFTIIAYLAYCSDCIQFHEESVYIMYTSSLQRCLESMTISSIATPSACVHFFLFCIKGEPR